MMTRHLLTLLIILAAVGAVGWKYLDYLRNPWTRDAQVRANVIQVAPRVSGPIVSLPIIDNQAVKAGDLLFEIDPRTFEAKLEETEANLDRTLDDLKALARQVEAADAAVAQYEAAIPQAESRIRAANAKLEETTANLDRIKLLVERQDVSQVRLDAQERLFEQDLSTKEQADLELKSAQSALKQAQASLAQAQAELGEAGDRNARLRAARAKVKQARLDLEFTQVRASVDGYVTNLKLRLGSQAVENTPALALVDVDSYWVDAYFRETLTRSIDAGDEAVITLMGASDVPLIGVVESIGWGIAQEDGSTGEDLLPSVSPTFEWVRLAQRIPVRVALTEVPDDIALRIGATASVLVRTNGNSSRVVAAPAILQ